MNDDEFEKLKKKYEGDVDVSFDLEKRKEIKSLIATVEHWKRRHRDLHTWGTGLHEENAKLKERLSVKEKINEDQNAYILKLQVSLETALKRIEEME